MKLYYVFIYFFKFSFKVGKSNNVSSSPPLCIANNIIVVTFQRRVIISVGRDGDALMSVYTVLVENVFLKCHYLCLQEK